MSRVNLVPALDGQEVHYSTAEQWYTMWAWTVHELDVGRGMHVQGLYSRGTPTGGTGPYPPVTTADPWWTDDGPVPMGQIGIILDNPYFTMRETQRYSPMLHGWSRTADMVILVTMDQMYRVGTVRTPVTFS